MPRDPDEPSIISAYGLPSLTITDEVGNIKEDLIHTDERYIVEEFGPFILSPGESFDVLGSVKEKGELIYVKVLTDNPYAITLLEIDDYRNGEAGETPAHLLYDNRTSTVEGQFYAVDGDPASGYALVYSPRVAEPYNYKVRLQVRNNLSTNPNVFGFSLNHVAKGGLPTPITPSWIGGSIFTHPAMSGADFDTLSNAMARPHGGTKYAVDAVFNEAVFTENLDLGKHSPYEGIAGKPVFRRDSGCLTIDLGTGIPNVPRGAQIVGGRTLLTAEVNTAQDYSTTSTTCKMYLGTDDFPGSTASPSRQKVLFYNQGGEAGGTGVPCEFAVGDRVFVRDGKTVYLPGVVTTVANIGTSGVNNSLECKPGLPTDDLPSELTLAVESETKCFGTIASHAEVEPNILVKKIVIKRKRLLALG